MPRNYTGTFFPGESISQKGHKKSWILRNLFMRNLRVHFLNRPKSWDWDPRCTTLNVSSFCNVLTNHPDSVRESQQFSYTFPGVSFLQVAPYFGGPFWEKGYAGSVSSALSLAFGVIGAHGQCVNSIRCRNRIRISNLCTKDGHVNVMIMAHPV